MNKRAWKGSLLALVFGFSFVVNPAFLSGCGAVRSFEFGEAEVVALLGDESLTREHRFQQRGEEYVLTITLTQQAGRDQSKSALVETVVRNAHACGQRTFLRSAAACLDVTEVPVEGRVKLAKATSPDVALLDAPSKGQLRVFGSKLTNVNLELTGEAHTVALFAENGRDFELQRMALKSAADGWSYERPASSATQ
jgi:hypothetical protein